MKKDWRYESSMASAEESRDIKQAPVRYGRAMGLCGITEVVDLTNKV